jgi:hypothetical protein
MKWLTTKPKIYGIRKKVVSFSFRHSSCYKNLKSHTDHKKPLERKNIIYRSDFHSIFSFSFIMSFKNSKEWRKKI